MARPIPPITKLQSLSTGEDLRLVDDFTGEKIAQPNAVPPPDVEDMIRQGKQREVEAQRRLLDRVFGAKPKPRLVKPEVKGMRPIGVVKVDGVAMAIYAPKPGWRRL